MYISIDQNLEFVCSGPYPCNYNKLKIKGLFNPNSLACNSADILLIISKLTISHKVWLNFSDTCTYKTLSLTDSKNL